MTLYFKHVYGPEVGEWGIVGFPKSQQAGAALKLYQPDDDVLLALPKKLGGKVFGRCTFAPQQGLSSTLANPAMQLRMPAVVRRWPTALPVKRLWMADVPFGYESMAESAESARGRMVPADALQEHVAGTTWSEVPVYHSDWVREHLVA